MTTALDILLLTDSQASWHFIDKLIEMEHETLQHAYDYILFAGGQANLINQTDQNPDKVAQEAGVKDHEQTMDKLQKLLSAENSHSKVIFVPGGSDPQTLFDENKSHE